jgi:hypothetical protein
VKAKFQVRYRSMTRPTRIFDRGGWRNTVRWTPWTKSSEHDTYAEAAEEANLAKWRTGLRQVAVFHRGRPYRESRNHVGDLLKIKLGSDALHGSGSNW